MATAERAAPEQRIVMHDVSWETYQSLLADRGERPVPRMSYDQGSLELMSPSDEHKNNKKLIGYLIFTWAVQQGIPFRSFGSTTFIREEQQRGFEPDECYYIEREPLMRGKPGIDLDVDPPPDLMVEVDVSRTSLKKLALCAGLAIPEVWRFDGKALIVYELGADGQYSIRADSLQLPGFPTAEVAEWIERAKATDETSWAQSFLAWIRQRGTRKNG
ncbi:MAG TPA: Uma2 family endonuclease [Pirellulales bacterium]|nr:Uma2 family endonuclease [Pirellulales bacterium]